MLTRSPCSRSTRWTPSGGDQRQQPVLVGLRPSSASGRCRSGRAPARGRGPAAAPPRRRRGGAAGTRARRAAAPAPRRAGRRPPPPAAAAAAGGGFGSARRCAARSALTAAERARPSATRWSVPLASSASSVLVEDLLVERVSSSSCHRRLLTGVPRCRRPCGSARSGPPGRYQHERQRQHVQHVPTQQRVRTDDHAAQQQEVRLLRDQRQVAGERRPHRDRPDRELVPGQQVAGERQAEREEQQRTPTTQLNSRGGL